MCKTCGCSGGATCQLALTVSGGSREILANDLGDQLLGAPGILQVRRSDAGEWLVDFNPQRTSAQAVKAFVTDRGYVVTGSVMSEPGLRHGVVAFLQRLAGGRSS